MNNFKLKLSILITLTFLLLIILIYNGVGTSLSFSSRKEIVKNREFKENLVKKIKINDIECPYDKNTNTFFFTIPSKYEGTNYALTIKLKKGYKYKILGQNLNLIKVDYNKTYKIVFYNSDYYYEANFVITNLPLVNIEVAEEINDSDIESTISYINQNDKNKVYNFNSLIHVRGATSKNFDKKSYKFKIYNADYSEEKNIQIKGFNYGHSFILDALYRDKSKIRNLISTEIWNTVSRDFTNVKINSKFVEVFINNEYMGLYLLTEPINRRTLKLPKSTETDTSFVIKARNWVDYSKDIHYSTYDESSSLGYEIKYPNDEEYFEDIWKKFIRKIEKYYTSEKTDTIIENTYNIDNYVDIIVFNAFINNFDCKLIKNIYFYSNTNDYEQLYIQPWDMEYSFGLNFTEDSITRSFNSTTDYEDIYTYFNHEDSPKTMNKIINRYKSLRKGALNRKYLDNMLDKYKNELNKGSTLRDSNKWYEYNVEEEIEYVRGWIHDRLYFFDEYVGDLENE